MRRGRGESGFALLAMLAIIALTSVIILALLSLSITSSQFSTQQIQRDRDTRAADGALDATVNVLRREASTQGVAGGPCIPFPAGSDGNPTVTVGGQDVRVNCVPLASRSPYVRPAGVESTESVSLVGADYGAGRGTVDPSGFDWGSALPGAAAASVNTVRSRAVNSSSLVHQGTDPLPFTSTVRVNSNTAAAVTNDGPGITVGAEYRQGGLGLLGTASAPCGTLNPADAALRYPSTQVRSVPLNPTCGDTAVAGVTAANVPDPDVLVNGEKPWVWTQSNVKLTRVTTAATVEPGKTPDLPANCDSLPLDNGSTNQKAFRRGPGGQVVVLRPGAYDAAATAVLNSWLTQGNCDNKVFWFVPVASQVFLDGQFWFDVTSGCPGADCGALVIDDPTSVVVFGEQGWGFGNYTLAAARAAFPRACDPDQPGLRVELSSRTSIRHKRGQVALCDRSSGEAPLEPVLWQNPRPSNSWPTDAAGAFQSNFPVGTQTQPYQDGEKAFGAPVTTFRRPAFNPLGLTTAGSPARLTMECPPFGPIITRPTCQKGLGSADWDGSVGRFVTTGGFQASATGRENDGVIGLNFVLTGQFLKLAPSSSISVIARRGAATCSLTASGSALGIPSDKSQVSTVKNLGSTGSVTLSGCGSLAATVAEAKQITVEVQVKLVSNCNYTEKILLIPVPWPENQCPSSEGLPYLQINDLQLRTEGSNLGSLGSAMLVTSNAPSTSGPGASIPTDVGTFNVYGRTFLPRQDLDLKWNGRATAVPLFGGSIWFNGIGSTMGNSASAATGIVCCTEGAASERRVLLQALLGPASNQYRLLGQAVVTLQDWRPAGVDDDGKKADVDGLQAVSKPGYRARIEAWRLCGNRSGSLASLLSTPATVCSGP